MTEITYIGLGSNLDQPLQQLRDAVIELASLPDTSLITTSSWYRSAPMGPQDQPDFINGVAKLQTSLPPRKLLEALQVIEQAHLRKKDRHWGPRHRPANSPPRTPSQKLCLAAIGGDRGTADFSRWNATGFTLGKLPI